MRYAVLILASVTLVGCDPDTMAAGCPALKNYPRETLSRAARELDALPRDSAILSMVKDYGALRAACRTK